MSESQTICQKGTSPRSGHPNSGRRRCSCCRKAKTWAISDSLRIRHDPNLRRYIDRHQSIRAQKEGPEFASLPDDGSLHCLQKEREPGSLSRATGRSVKGSEWILAEKNIEDRRHVRLENPRCRAERLCLLLRQLLEPPDGSACETLCPLGPRRLGVRLWVPKPLCQTGHWRSCSCRLQQ